MRTVQWVVSLEGHAEAELGDDNVNSYHFHMALKLDRRGRWLRVRKNTWMKRLVSKRTLVISTTRGLLCGRKSAGKSVVGG